MWVIVSIYDKQTNTVCVNGIWYIGDKTKFKLYGLKKLKKTYRTALS